MDVGSYHFECLRCGAQAEMSDLPPRCPKCASGNGIVSERKLPDPLPIQPDPVTRAMAI